MAATGGEFDPRYDPRFQRGWVEGPPDAAAPAESPPATHVPDTGGTGAPATNAAGTADPATDAAGTDAAGTDPAETTAAPPDDPAHELTDGRRRVDPVTPRSPVETSDDRPRARRGRGPDAPADRLPDPALASHATPTGAADDRAERIITVALAGSLAVALLTVLVGAASVSWLVDDRSRYRGARSTTDMVIGSFADGVAPGLVTAGLVGLVVLAVADGVRRSLGPGRRPRDTAMRPMIQALLDRSVLVLAAAAALGGAAIWRFVSWRVAAEQIWSELQDDAPAPEQQRLLVLYDVLPYLLTPTASMLLVTALIGLPVVIGARYASITRWRREED